VSSRRPPLQLTPMCVNCPPVCLGSGEEPPGEEDNLILQIMPNITITGIHTCYYSKFISTLESIFVNCSI
jgi:hypothetical protein